MKSIIEEWLNIFDSKETRCSYKYDISKFQGWLSANNITFKDITLKDLQRWQRTLGKSPADRRLISAVKSFLSYSFNQGYLPTDVGRCLKAPKKTEIRVERKLSKEEVHRMLEITKGNDRLLLKLLFYLGLRLSEARRLKRADIKNVKNELQFSVVGKGNKFRKISLSRKLSREIVQNLLSKGYLFRGRNGCLSRSQSYRRVKRMAKQVVSKASPHWLRHGFCYLSLVSGAPVMDVSKAMGHSSISTTSKYMHATDKPVSSLVCVVSPLGQQHSPRMIHSVEMLPPPPPPPPDEGSFHFHWKKQEACGVATCGTKEDDGNAFGGIGGATCDSPGSILVVAKTQFPPFMTATVAVAAASKNVPRFIFIVVL